MPDDVFGFNKQDTNAILRGLGDQGGEVRLFTHPSGVQQFVGYQFTLTSSLSTGTGTADITEMDGSTSVETGATIKASMSAFEELGTGDSGWCWKQGDVYYVGNANCPAEV